MVLKNGGIFNQMSAVFTLLFEAKSFKHYFLTTNINTRNRIAFMTKQVCQEVFKTQLTGYETTAVDLTFHYNNLSRRARMFFKEEGLAQAPFHYAATADRLFAYILRCIDEEMMPEITPDIVKDEWKDKNADFETLFDKSHPTIGH